jgi:Flp pilus assembly protein TadB
MNGPKPGQQLKPQQPNFPQLTEATVQRMLAVQEQKLSLELKQAEISLREIDHNQKIADKSIEAQVSDRRDERAVEKAMHLHRLVFAGVIVAALLAFVLVALHWNKDALVLDLVKVLLGFVGGWGASAAWRHQKSAQKSGDNGD